MINLSKEQVLCCLFDSFPGKIVVRDLEGRSLYGNQLSDSSSSSSSYCNEEDGELRESLFFPVKDSNGNVVGRCSIDFTSEEGFVKEKDTTNSTRCTSSTSCDDPTHLIIQTETDIDQHHLSHTTNDEDVETQIVIYQTIMEKIQTAVTLCEVVVNDQNQPIDYVFLYANPAFEHFLGISPQDCIGRRVTEIIPGIEQDCVNWIQFFGNVGVNHVYEEFTQYSQRLENWYTGIAYPTNPKRHGFAVLFHESSDHIESQEALRESEEQHRNLFESMMQGVVYHSSDGTIISSNPAAERILGLTKDQLMGRTSVDPRWKAIKEDGSDFPGNEHPSMVALQTGKPVLSQIMGVFSPKDNAYHWIKVDAVPRYKSSMLSTNNDSDTTADMQEKPWQVFTTFTDITETKNFENKLLSAIQKAEEADQLKSAFLANMSHEIRTPLNGIMGHIDLILANNLDEHYRPENLEGLRIAKTSGTLLLSIIQDILDLSKIEAGQMVIHLEESFSLKSTVKQTSSLAKADRKSVV